MRRIFAFIPHQNGVADDAAAELVSAALKIDPAAEPVAVVTGSGAELDAACESLRGLYAEIWKIAHEALAYPNAEVVRKALVGVLPAGSIVLVPHAHFGVDLSPGLSVKMNAAYLPDVVDIEGVEDTALKAVRQEFGGQVSAHVECDISTGAVINIRPGAFVRRTPWSAGDPLVPESRPGSPPQTGANIIDKPVDTADLSAGRRYLGTIAAETGAVDITKHKVLVSVGRGIQEKDNIAIAEELAEALGGAVSCSRPVVDARWLEKSRQVGSSGQTVKPKVYLACGISGSFQHLAGIKGNPLIVAINKNPKAPIFRAAHIGIVADILEFLPELTEKVREERVHA
jgi:electron transfer flavoprotein alpha subunit